MATITYAYAINSEVFHVDDTKGVRDAIVKALTVTITPAGTTLTYDVAFKKSSEGSANVQESTLYADVDLALAAYRPLVIIA